MLALRFVVFSAIFYSAHAGPAGEPLCYTFTAGNHNITMEVRSSKPYIGTRLVFYDDKDPLKPVCFTGNGENGACPSHFVGAVALVTFTVKAARGKLGSK